MIRKQLRRISTAVLAVSAAASISAAAADRSFPIDLAEDNAGWAQVAMTNDDEVETGIIIRKEQDAKSPAAGYLYRGGAVKVLERGEDWSKVQSGSVEGYVRNQYLTFGTEAKGLAEYYGEYGVKASWDDVKVFAADNADAVIVDTAMDGKTYPIVNNNGHWLEVRIGEDETAYVSEEDIDMVILVDSAYGVDEEGPSFLAGTSAKRAAAAQNTAADPGTYSGTSAPAETAPAQTEEASPAVTCEEPIQETIGTYTAEAPAQAEETPAQTEPVYEEPAAAEETPAQTEPAYEEPAAAEETYTAQETSEEYTYTDTVEETYTDDSYTDETYTDAAADDGSSAAASEDTSDTDSSYTDGSYTDASTTDGSYTDDSYTDGSYTDDSYTDGSYTDDSYTDASYTEESYTDTSADTSGSEQSSSYGSSDLDLLAAIIYHEAGNQSEEGKIAVGAVVLNRVNSGLFPNTISEVLYQAGQFTPASELAATIANGVPQSCYDAANAALAGQDPTGGCLYVNTSHGSGVKIGAHWYYS